MTVNLGGVSTWTLCKPYSYFEKVAAVRARAAASACGVTPPTLPKRKILIFDNKTLLANLGTYMGRVVDLLKFWQRTQSSLPDGSTNSDVGAKKAALQRLLRILDLTSDEVTSWSRTVHDKAEARLLLHRAGADADSGAAALAPAWAAAEWSEEECALLLGAGMVVQRIEAGEHVMREGEAADFVAVLLRGALVAAAGERTLGTKAAGDVLGELAPFQGGVRGYDVSATADAAVAILGCRQLELMRRAEEPAVRRAAEKLNELLARCALRAELAEWPQRDGAIEAAKAAEPAPSELARLYAQQQTLAWAAPAEGGRAGAPRPAAPLTPHTAPKRAASLGGGEGEGEVAMQGELRLESLADAGPPAEYARHWAVLVGSTLHLYAAPQAAAPRGAVHLSGDSGLRLRAHDGATTFALSRVTVQQLAARAPPAATALVFCAATKAETRRWAEAIRAMCARAPSEAPPLAVRQAALQRRGGVGASTGAGGGAARPGAEPSLRAMLPEEVQRLLRGSGPREDATPGPPLSCEDFEAAQAALLQRRRAVEHPFAVDLDAGLTVWELARAGAYAGLRRVAVLEPTAGGTYEGLALQADRCYLLLNARYGGEPGGCAPPTPRGGGAAAVEELELGRGADLSSEQLSVEIHFWVGSSASADAAGAAAVFALHLMHALEAEARTHREAQADESALCRSYFAPGALVYTEPAEAAAAAATWLEAATAASTPLGGGADAAAPPPLGADLARRRHPRHALWPPLPAPVEPVLYHVAGARAPPSRVNLAVQEVAPELYLGVPELGLKSEAAFVLDVLEAPPAAVEGGGGGGGGGGGEGEPTRRQYVWGGAGLAERPAAAARMAAALLARGLHFRDHRGASELVLLPDGTPPPAALLHPRGATSSQGVTRGLSGRVRALLVLRVCPDDAKEAAAPPAAANGRPGCASVQTPGSAAARRRAKSLPAQLGSPFSLPDDAGDGDEEKPRLSIGAMAVREAMQAEVLQAEIRLDPDDEDEDDEDEEEASERLRVEVLRPELPADDRPPAALLRSTDVVVVATEGQVHVWSGAHSLPFQRWAGARLGAALEAAAACEAAAAREAAAGFALRRLAEGCEPAYFCSLFAGWPQPASAPTQLALLHPTAAVVRTAHRSFVPAASSEWPLPLDDVAAMLRVGAADAADAEVAAEPSELIAWEVTKEKEERLADASLGVFRSDRCYMLLHSCTPPGDGGGSAPKKRHLLVFWVGAHAERFYFLGWKLRTAQLMKDQAPNLRELVCEQGREPPQFFDLFRTARQGYERVRGGEVPVRSDALSAARSPRSQVKPLVPTRLRPSPHPRPSW